MFVSKVKVVAKVARTVALAGAITSLALATACKKDGDAGGGSGGSSAKAAASALGYMPKDASMVFGINVASAAKAPVLAKYREMMMKQAPKEFNEMQEVCGMDFMKDVSSVVVGVTDSKMGVVVVSGNFNQAKVEECMTKASAKEGKKVVMADDGKLRSYTAEGENEVMYAHWPADGTAVFSSSEMGGKETLSAVLGGAKLADGAVMSLVNSTKTSATLWVAGDPSNLAKGSPIDGQQVTGIAGTINAGDTLDIKALVNFASDAKASELAAVANTAIAGYKDHPLAASVKSIMEKFKIEADGKAIKAGVSMTGEEIDKVAGLAKQFGGMGGF